MSGELPEMLFISRVYIQAGREIAYVFSIGSRRLRNRKSAHKP